MKQSLLVLCRSLMTVLTITLPPLFDTLWPCLIINKTRKVIYTVYMLKQITILLSAELGSNRIYPSLLGGFISQDVSLHIIKNSLATECFNVQCHTECNRGLPLAKNCYVNRVSFAVIYVFFYEDTERERVLKYSPIFC